MSAQGKVATMRRDELDETNWLERLEFPHVLPGGKVCLVGVVYVNTAEGGGGVLWEVFRDTGRKHRTSIVEGKSASIEQAKADTVLAMRNWRDVVEANFVLTPKQEAPEPVHPLLEGLV